MTTLKEKPALFATTVTALTALIALVPGLNVLAFIAVMLPLSLVDKLSPVALGVEKHGFFVPNTPGWMLIVGAVWLFWFWIARSIRKYGVEKPPAA